MTAPNTQKERLSEDKILGETPLDENDYYEVPRINIKLEYSVLAEQIANSIPHGALYLIDGHYYTITENLEEAALEKKEMTASRFTTWVTEYCRFYSPKSGITSLSPAQAQIILDSDQLSRRIPRIDSLCPIRLPIIDPHSKNLHFIPAKVGYDSETKIYTLDTIPINWGKIYPLETCRRTLITIFSEFALDGGLIGGPGDESTAVSPVQSPSLGACVTAMLGQFLHHLISLFPLILLNANKRGTGKTFLAKVCLAPVWGEVSPSNYSTDENELKKMLNSFLFTGEPICLLDDVKSLNNNTLNRYITSSRIKDRELSTNRMFDKPQRMQFFATGNNLKSSEDIERRSIPIDLFFARDLKKRQFAYRVSEASLKSKTWRADVLQVLWSILVHWERAGHPAHVRRGALLSFDTYAFFAINPVIHAGFANPLGTRIIKLDSGDAMGHALVEVIIAIADSILPEYTNAPHKGLYKDFRIPDLIERADAMDKLDIVTNGAYDTKRSFGMAMRQIKGNEYTDSWGRYFSVGNRRDSASTRYRFTILSEPTTTPETGYPSFPDPPDDI